MTERLHAKVDNTAPLDHEIGALIGEHQLTASRFSLVRPKNNNRYVRDVIKTEKVDKYRRFLLIENQAVNSLAYEQLEKAQVPQLPLIQKGDKLSVFGVRDGLKLLAHESLHGHASSETYISDKEVFQQVGRLYADAWRATGSVLLDGINDSPLHHVALSSFSEGADLLYLCPPFADSVASKAATFQEATALFTYTIQQHFERHSGYIYNAEQRQFDQQLTEAAYNGFVE